MKEKTKEFMKKYLIGFILGVVSAGTIAVYAETYFPSNDVTYDNKESGLSATNVQSAIDELYNVCFPPKSGGDIIEELVPTNPEEIYKDENGDTRYYGKNPNNYISFNDELWRIIGVFDGKIKIVRNESIGDMSWNSNSGNNWNNATLKDYLNVDYYNSINETYKNMISEETYYLGGPTSDNFNSLTASDYYDVERSNSVNNGNPTSTIQHIGLIYPSDYGYAAGNSCLSAKLTFPTDACKNNNYLSLEQWTQTPGKLSGLYSSVVFIDPEYGAWYNRTLSAGSKFPIYPSLYLTTTVKITGGTGQKDNPYTIK